jgi:hypothetical protein
MTAGINDTAKLEGMPRAELPVKRERCQGILSVKLVLAGDPDADVPALVSEAMAGVL